MIINVNYFVCLVENNLTTVHEFYRLIKCRGSQNPNLEHVCGRPLGLRFNDKTGELFVADAYLGLLVVGPDDKFATPIAKQAQGVEFHVTNGLDIDPDSGAVYFTDSSMRFQRRYQTLPL